MKVVLLVFWCPLCGSWLEIKQENPSRRFWFPIFPLTDRAAHFGNFLFVFWLPRPQRATAHPSAVSPGVRLIELLELPLDPNTETGQGSTPLLHLVAKGGLGVRPETAGCFLVLSFLVLGCNFVLGSAESHGFSQGVGLVYVLARLFLSFFSPIGVLISQIAEGYRRLFCEFSQVGCKGYWCWLFCNAGCWSRCCKG